MVTMDIREADPRAHLYGMERQWVQWKTPKSRLQCWYTGSRHFVVNKTTRARKRLMAKMLKDGRENE